jgi:Tfp pilus assembly protein PilX
MRLNLIASQRGMAALVALLMVGMLTLLGLAALSTSDDDVAISGNEMKDTRAFYAAEAGLERACASLRTQFETTGLPPTVMPTGTDSINNCAVTYRTADDGAAVQDVLETGALAGLHALVKSYTVTAVGSNSFDQAKVQMSQKFETDFIPLFQFAVFYGNDLEIAPGADMTLVGRVHSNGNMYVQANTTLRMDSYVTASGHFLHGRKAAGAVGNGDVQIKNTSGAYTSIKLGSSDWLDAKKSYWYDSSLARWGGRVKDAAHGQQELNVPLTNSTDPHKLIEPAAGNPDSYENKATLKIVDNKAYQLISGTWTDVTTNMTTAGIITFTPNKFTDGRETKVADVMDLDVGKMYASTYKPANGVLYFSDAVGTCGDFPALRLKNGATLGAPLTVASANPVYTVGNFNSTSKKPAAILADALTFLSSSWDDTKSALAKTNRVAVNTTVNCSYLTGNVNSTATNYSGGFENLPRFLETWSGKTLTWAGSAVCLWFSKQATAPWGVNDCYDPPTRAWSYDTALDDPANLPPEAPVVRVFQRTGWKQENVGYANN